MATSTVSPNPAGWLRMKYVVFGLVFLMMAYVLRHNESFLINRKDPVWEHYRLFKWWLLPHGLAGACAILLGPMQFSDRLRKRFTKLHRVTGRIYVFGAMVVAPLGTYIQYFDERLGGPRSFTMAAAADASLLMITTGIAFYFALKRRITLHRQWMTRSYAVAIIFLEVRVISGLGGWDNSLAASETIVWLCVAFSLLIGDLAVQWQESQKSRPVVTRAAAAD
ncbi:MAG TPA: DUF2306 domain-containing protein [Terriglobales bacterium]|nr:DUF2306 domain-containing protein [Terriglobales bacterium]